MPDKKTGQYGLAGSSAEPNSTVVVEKGSRSVLKQNTKRGPTRQATDRCRQQLSRLCAMRYGSTFVPNSSDGRAILLALLRCSLKDEDAMTDAPWLDRAELPKLRRKARRINWYDIGTVVKCSYDERKAGRFHILRPYDVTWEEVQRRQKENRLLKERERSRRNRLKRWEEREMMRNEVSRESAVMRLLTAVWMPVAELVEKIEKNRQQAFQYRLSDGKPLKPNGLRKLVHVALRKLEELGQIEIEMVEGPRGPVGMARKIDLHSDLENDPENLPAAYDFLHRETVKREADDAAEAKTFATAKPSLRSKARTHQIKKAVRNIRRERTVDDEDRMHLKRYSTDEQTKH